MHSQTHTLKEIQSITEIIEGRIMFWEDVNPKGLIPDVRFIWRFWVVSTKNSTPQKYKLMLL